MCEIIWSCASIKLSITSEGKIYGRINEERRSYKVLNRTWKW